MVNEYNNGNTSCIVPVGGTKPTHGDYVLGSILIDENAYPDGGIYKLTNTSVPLTWSRLINRFHIPRNISFDGKYGWYVGNTMQIRGEGIMSDVIGFGATFSPNAVDGSGSSHAFGSGTDAIRNTGIGILRPVGSFAGFTRSSFTPGFMIRDVLPARVGGDLRNYSGWITNTTGMALAEDPIIQADGGVVVGFNSTDANFNVWHGDGTNPITKVELTPAVPVPTAVTNYIIEMKFIGSSNLFVAVYGGNSFLLLGSKFITTNLPSSTKSLNWQSVLQNPLQTNKSNTIHSCSMEILR